VDPGDKREDGRYGPLPYYRGPHDDRGKEVRDDPAGPELDCRCESGLCHRRQGDPPGNDLLPALDRAIHARDPAARKSPPDHRCAQVLDAGELAAGRQGGRGAAKDHGRDGQALKRGVRVQGLVPLLQEDLSPSAHFF